MSCFKNQLRYNFDSSKKNFRTQYAIIYEHTHITYVYTEIQTHTYPYIYRYPQIYRHTHMNIYTHICL